MQITRVLLKTRENGNILFEVEENKHLSKE